VVGFPGVLSNGSILCFSSVWWQVVQAIAACLDKALVLEISAWQALHS
jgi:hypothetical protein